LVNPQITLKKNAQMLSYKALAGFIGVTFASYAITYEEPVRRSHFAKDRSNVFAGSLSHGRRGGAFFSKLLNATNFKKQIYNFY